MIQKTLPFLIASLMLCGLSNCISLEEANKQPLKAYVITEANGKKIMDSGVRVGPLDLKYETEQTLNKYGLNSTLIERLKQYFGLSGKKAEEQLQDKPFELTQSEFDIITKKVKDFYLPKVAMLPGRFRKDKRVKKLMKLATGDEWPTFLQETDMLRKKFPKITSLVNSL